MRPSTLFTVLFTSTGLFASARLSSQKRSHVELAHHSNSKRDVSADVASIQSIIDTILSDGTDLSKAQEIGPIVLSLASDAANFSISYVESDSGAALSIPVLSSILSTVYANVLADLPDGNNAGNETLSADLDALNSIISTLQSDSDAVDMAVTLQPLINTLLTDTSAILDSILPEFSAATMAVPFFSAMFQPILASLVASMSSQDAPVPAAPSTLSSSDTTSNATALSTLVSGLIANTVATK